MPSPTGRNRAGLFLPASFGGPVAAYDGKYGLRGACDGAKFNPEGELDLEDNHPVVAAMKYARQRLNSAECQALKHLLGKAALSSPKEEEDFEDTAEDDESDLSPEKQRATAQGGLCHEASIQPVARPNRSSATRSIDNSLGGIFLHR